MRDTGLDGGTCSAHGLPPGFAQRLRPPASILPWGFSLPSHHLPSFLEPSILPRPHAQKWTVHSAGQNWEVQTQDTVLSGRDSEGLAASVPWGQTRGQLRSPHTDRSALLLTWGAGCGCRVSVSSPVFSRASSPFYIS